MATSRKRKGANQSGRRKPPASPQTSRTTHPTPSPEPQSDDIRVFLSYARADDQAFGMVRPFKTLLRTLVHAKSGRKISTFLDQDDIKWGELWKERLDSEILRSTIFIPLLSANYLESTMCRMEFNKFYAAADALGVKELLLPVLLLDAPAVFNPESSDDLVRTAVARQYEIIEGAILSEPGSSEWKRTMARLADKFTSVYQAAEANIVAIDPDSISQGSSPDDEDDADDDRPGLAELFDAFQSDITEMTSEAKGIGAAITDLGNATGTIGTLPENPSPSDIQRWSLRAAHALSNPSKELSDRGERLLASTQRLDKTVSGFRQIVAEVPEYEKTFQEMLASLGGLEEVREQLEALLQSMRPAESISVPLRRAIRPASRGLTRVTDAISIIETWS